jgi:hypothetical protein
MFQKIDYFAPYFNDTSKLREAYQLEYPNYSFDNIYALMVGALAVYVPTEKFDELVANVLADAKAKAEKENN